MLLDLAFDHTVVFGPLVVPGQTACAPRLHSRVWSAAGVTPRPPPLPAATGDAELAGLLLGRLLSDWPSRCALVERMISVDLDTLRSHEAPVFRAPDQFSARRLREAPG